MIILGGVTVIMGFISFFFLIDTPKAPALRLNAEQEILVEERTRDNATVRTTEIKTEQIWEAVKEVRFWCFSIACLLINLQNGAMTIYNGQITASFGFDVSLFLIVNKKSLVCSKFNLPLFFFFFKTAITIYAAHSRSRWFHHSVYRNRCNTSTKNSANHLFCLRFDDHQYCGYDPAFSDPCYPSQITWILYGLGLLQCLCPFSHLYLK